MRQGAHSLAVSVEASPRTRDIFTLHALEATNLGFRVVPLRRGAKTPLLRAWPRLATTDPAQICEWGERWPDANVGISLEGLLVLDVDTREAEQYITSLKLPATATVQTARGRHRYFRGRPERPVRTLRDGLDVKTGGAGLAVAPGSLVEGHLYTWAEGCHPHETPIADAPRDLLELVERKALASIGGSRDASTNLVHEGRRHDELTRLAGRLYNAGRRMPEARVSFLSARSRTPRPSGPLTPSRSSGFGRALVRPWRSRQSDPPG